MPKDWLFKVKEGNVGRTNGYKMMCKEGQLLESAKAAMDYIQVINMYLLDSLTQPRCLRVQIKASCDFLSLYQH